MKGPEPRRSSPRHPRFDYRTEAAYFVTINTYRRRPLFGAIKGGIVHPTRAGTIVTEEWLRSEDLRETVVLDAFVVMPNRPQGDSWSIAE